MKFVKPIVFILCLLPFVLLTESLYYGRFIGDDVNVYIRRIGEWAMWLLLITLCMTPLRDALKQSWPIKLRRMLGLFSFFYVCVHLSIYFWLEQEFYWDEIWFDILERPFITVGMLAFVILFMLAMTSTRGMQRRLGKRWKRLHQLVYPAAILVVFHFFWLVKRDELRPITIAVCVALLLIYRLHRSRQRQAHNLRKPISASA